MTKLQIITNIKVYTIDIIKCKYNKTRSYGQVFSTFLITDNVIKKENV